MSIVIAACVVFAIAMEARQAKGERILDPDVVDLRGMWKGDTLDRLKARAKGIDPDQVRTPRKIKDVRPEFPGEAYRSGVNGTVVIDCIIDTAGKPQDCRVVTGPRELRDAALKAVVGWRWEPLRLGGTPRRAAVQLSVSFSMREPSSHLEGS